jgi:hypothetical protein
VRAGKRKSGKRGVGGLMGKGLKGPGNYWGGVITGHFRNREREKKREVTMPTGGSHRAAREREG